MMVVRSGLHLALLVATVPACAAPGEPITTGEIVGGTSTSIGASTTGVLASSGEITGASEVTSVGTEEAGTAEASAEASSGGDSSSGDVEIPSEAIGWAGVAAEGVNGTIGGAGGATVVVTTLEALEEQAAGEEPRIIQISGVLNGYVTLAGSNKTIEGLPGAELYGGISLFGMAEVPLRNIIVRNLRIVAPPCESDCEEYDALSLRWAHHVWIDHCDLWDGTDGNLDITRESDYVTVSWTRFSYSDPELAVRQSNLVGGADEHVEDADDLRVTFHHNWWTENVAKFMPRIRFGQVHLFNNYYTAVDNDDCIRLGLQANAVIEGNVFEGAEHPLGDSVDETAVVRAIGNSATPEPVEDLVIGDAFTPPYPYTLDPVDEVAERVRAGAGTP